MNIEDVPMHPSIPLRDRIATFVKEGKIVWTMTTWGYKFYTLNLLKWLKTEANVRWTLCIICCDKESWDFFRRERIPCVLWKTLQKNTDSSVTPFGCNHFRTLNRVKLEILDWFSEQAEELCDYSLYLDGDIVVQKDPWQYILPILQIYPYAFQCDCSHLEEHTPETPCKAPCSGVIATNHSASVKGLYKMDEALWDASEGQDQPYITTRLNMLDIPYTTLNRSKFGNGIWQQSLRWNQEPWVLLHYNHRVGDTKKNAMKHFHHWKV